MRREIILTFAVLCVFHDWTLGVDSKMVHLHQPGLNSSIPLDMVPTSVDDMYNGCTEQMYNKVEKEYLEHENKEPFKNAWMWAESCANTKSKYNSKDKLSHNHIKAICAYTAGHPALHSVFNKAVRTSGTEYTTSFQFHSLHFLLTDAIHLLKKKQQPCHTTYRRTKMMFVGKVDQKIRFGYFTSSSLNKDNSEFGEKSCFEIKTCFGAYLKSFHKMGTKEDEVLIPPYEEFKVTAVLKKEDDPTLWCDVVNKLQSTKIAKSNLNCKMFKKPIIN
ncbi:erythroblast NAD(P)(+)--arginine ADP-ribosyltransferase-like [Salmo trutta]|uniref:NAD(P)(+)--arginine ADP-ribosyltransferase n=1 Tax=Salmo trutta TaxID=8032 RepID=A0A673W861_SALTR|nr:erythroblast NAD(P)(+)--arginine ADP-ribosyltransferase-like [Salmo trutta]